MSKKSKIRILTHFVLFLTALSLLSCATGKKQTTQNSSVQNVIKNARSFTGVPYKWGGTTRAGMDCSGLLLISFKSAGLGIPRTTKEQSKIGKSVSIYELQPGDLVFFKAGKYKSKITHVGMVTEVRARKDVRFIHASTSLGVIESNLFSDYYHNIFVKARRPF